MNKILKQSFSISRRYLINREAVSLKEIEFCSTPLDLSQDSVSPTELIVKISQQIDPQNLVKLYSKYSESYAERHILQSLKISARMIGIYYLPLNDYEFFDSYKKMVRQFNQYLPTLNNLDLADYLYWYKKFSNDNAANQLLNQIDHEALKSVIIKYIKENQFLPRQLNMIYECIDMIFPNNEELMSQFIENLFSTNDITATQLLQFLSSINKKFAIEKRLDQQAVLQFLLYSNKIKSFDVDQIASIVKSVSTMKLHLFVTERKFLEFIEYAFEVTQQNISYLEQGPLLNLLTAKKYLPKNSGSQFFLSIHEKFMQLLHQQKTEANLEFLIPYTIRTINFDYVTESDKEFLIDLSIQILEKNFQSNESIHLTLLLIRLKKVNQRYIQLLKKQLETLVITNYNTQHVYLIYLYWVCGEDVTEYLIKINNQCDAISSDEDQQFVSRVCAANIMALYDEYNSKSPSYLFSIMQRQTYVSSIQTIGACLFKSERMENLYLAKINSLRAESVRFEHSKFWSQLLSMVHSHEEAIALSDWLSLHKPAFLNQALPLIFTSQDIDDITKDQAVFLHVFLFKNLKNLNMEIVMNGIIYTEKLFQLMVEYNPEILDTLFSYSYRCKDGLGTAQLIQLLEEKFPDRMNEFPIEKHLKYNYNQLKQYDTNFILMMIRYGCIPLQDCLKIYHNMINFSSNELRLLILLLAMSKTLTMEKLQVHIKEQLKNLNETYLIQIS